MPCWDKVNPERGIALDDGERTCCDLAVAGAAIGGYASFEGCPCPSPYRLQVRIVFHSNGRSLLLLVLLSDTLGEVKGHNTGPTVRLPGTLRQEVSG